MRAHRHVFIADGIYYYIIITIIIITTTTTTTIIIITTTDTSGCRRGRWGVTGIKSVRGVGPVRRRAGAQAWLVHQVHVRTARQGWWWPTRLEI